MGLALAAGFIFFFFDKIQQQNLLSESKITVMIVID